MLCCMCKYTPPTTTKVRSTFARAPQFVGHQQCCRACFIWKQPSCSICLGSKCWQNAKCLTATLFVAGFVCKGKQHCEREPRSVQSLSWWLSNRFARSCPMLSCWRTPRECWKRTTKAALWSSLPQSCRSWTHRLAAWATLRIMWRWMQSHFSLTAHTSIWEGSIA